MKCKFETCTMTLLSNLNLLSLYPFKKNIAYLVVNPNIKNFIHRKKLPICDTTKIFRNIDHEFCVKNLFKIFSLAEENLHRKGQLNYEFNDHLFNLKKIVSSLCWVKKIRENEELLEKKGRFSNLVIINPFKPSFDLRKDNWFRYEYANNFVSNSLYFLTSFIFLFIFFWVHLLRFTVLTILFPISRLVIFWKLAKVRRKSGARKIKLVASDHHQLHKILESNYKKDEFIEVSYSGHTIKSIAASFFKNLFTDSVDISLIYNPFGFYLFESYSHNRRFLNEIFSRVLIDNFLSDEIKLIIRRKLFFSGVNLSMQHKQINYASMFLDRFIEIDEFISSYALGLGASMAYSFYDKSYIKTTIITHGSHSWTKDKIGNMEISMLSRGMLTSPVFKYTAIQTKISEHFYRNFKENLDWRVPKQKSMKNMMLKCNKKTKKSERFFLYAITQKTLENIHFYCNETEDEYISSLAKIVSLFNKTSEQLVVKLHPASAYSSSELSSIVEAKRNVLFVKDESFCKLLHNCKGLISFSSTTIEQAVQLKKPVILFDAWSRFQYIDTENLDNASNISYVNSIKDLNHILQKFA